MLRETYVGPVCSPQSSRAKYESPEQFESSRIDGKFDATSLMFICEIILHSYLLFFMPRNFSYILHNILYSCPLFCRLSLSHSHLYHINLITFEMFGGATIENGFATLAMCSASFGQLLMVLSICPLPSALFSLHSSPHSLPVPLPLYSSRASHVLHAQQF